MVSDDRCIGNVGTSCQLSAPVEEFELWKSASLSYMNFCGFLFVWDTLYIYPSAANWIQKVWWFTWTDTPSVIHLYSAVEDGVIGRRYWSVFYVSVRAAQVYCLLWLLVALAASVHSNGRCYCRAESQRHRRYVCVLGVVVLPIQAWTAHHLVTGTPVARLHGWLVSLSLLYYT